MILAYVATTPVYALASYPAGLVADRVGKPTVFGIGLVFFAVGYTGLGMTTDPLTAWLLIGVYGLFTGCTDGVGKAWISSLVGRMCRAVRRGCSRGSAASRCWRPGLWAGLLWGADGQLPLLISGIAGGVVAAVVLVIAISGRYRASTSRSSSAKGGAPTPATE